uniref:C-type lectin domain-containing protein n=1 Tax=Amphiprion ocellaris TaxID=80972 RepID=A0AAQ5YBH9_AMPOC
MKILVLLSLSFAVALGMPASPPGVPQSPDMPKEEQSPLLGDSVPVQGHVEVENPAPQARLSSTEQQEKLAAVDVKQSKSPLEAQPEVKVEEAGPEFMAEEDRPVFDEQTEGAGRRFLPNPERKELSYCTGVVFEEKCYQFFREPRRFADAEFFCQNQFIGGHLASITSPRIHRDVMDLMQTTIGTQTRTWVGGLRFLDTGRFVWLDGSFWDYSDWLYREPNNTANKEECLEVLGNGKFNDFTCWEPQAFICSYPHE